MLAAEMKWKTTFVLNKGIKMCMENGKEHNHAE